MVGEVLRNIQIMDYENLLGSVQQRLTGLRLAFGEMISSSILNSLNSSQLLNPQIRYPSQESSVVQCPPIVSWSRIVIYECMALLGSIFKEAGANYWKLWNRKNLQSDFVLVLVVVEVVVVVLVLTERIKGKIKHWH